MLQGVADTAYLSRSLLYALPRVAGYCAPGGVKVVSTSMVHDLQRWRLPARWPRRTGGPCAARLGHGQRSVSLAPPLILVARAWRVSSTTFREIFEPFCHPTYESRGDAAYFGGRIRYKRLYWTDSVFGPAAYPLDDRKPPSSRSYGSRGHRDPFLFTSVSCGHGTASLARRECLEVGDGGDDLAADYLQRRDPVHVRDDADHRLDAHAGKPT